MDEFENWCCAAQGFPHVNQGPVTTTVILDMTPPTFTVVTANPNPAGAPEPAPSFIYIPPIQSPFHACVGWTTQTCCRP